MNNEDLKITFEGNITPEQILVAFEALFSEKEIADLWQHSYDNYLKEKNENS